jgi:hypothetical protein
MRSRIASVRHMGRDAGNGGVVALPALMWRTSPLCNVSVPASWQRFVKFRASFFASSIVR